jgi:hypothetical protein
MDLTRSRAGYTLSAVEDGMARYGYDGYFDVDARECKVCWGYLPEPWERTEICLDGNTDICRECCQEKECVAAKNEALTDEEFAAV